MDEVALALELLEVSSDAELDQFLGKVFKKIGRAAKSLVKGPLGKAFKGIAKAALPVVGGALGSFIPIPGVGTALGSALGSAASKALEAEFDGLDREIAQLEVAQRLVRIAADAAVRLRDPADPRQAQSAIVAAASRHIPGLQRGPQPAAGRAMAM